MSGEGRGQESRESQHPREWGRDLNDPLATGIDRGMPRWEAEGVYRTAYDLKPVHDRLQSIADDELKRIPVVPPGARLEQGATYLDLLAPLPQAFSARADIEAQPDNAYVDKAEVDYELWNTLLDQLAA